MKIRGLVGRTMEMGRSVGCLLRSVRTFLELWDGNGDSVQLRRVVGRMKRDAKRVEKSWAVKG